MANEAQLISDGILETQRLSAKTGRILDLMRGTPSQANDSQIGEHFAALSRAYGKIAAAHLFRSEWCYVEPEWFDHRLHLLDPETHFNDFWTASSDNAIGVLPLGGRLLDLCSGDGFYDYWFYRHRAEIVAVERDVETLNFALKHHSDAAISYVLADVLTYQPTPDHFDVVLIRGAIEHFTRDDQQRIFRKAWTALKKGGWFCGDTPAKRGEEIKALEAHEFEWKTELEMRAELSGIFDDNPYMMKTRTLISRNRTTLLWKCQKA